MGTIDKVPEPTGPPEPVQEFGDGASAGGAGPSLGGIVVRVGELGLILTASGVALLAIASFMTPALGATRSVRLVWQQRQAETEQAVAEAERPGAADGAPPAREVQ